MSVQPEVAPVASQPFSLDQIRGLLDNAPVAVWFSRDGMVIFANRQVCRMLGAQDRAQVEGRTSVSFVHPDTHDEALAARELANGNGAVNAAFTMVRFDGAPVEVEATAWRVNLEDGPAYQVMMFDVTERNALNRRAFHQHEMLENIYRTVPIGLAYLDRDLRFLYVNDLLARLNNVPAPQHIGRTAREVIPSLADAVEPYMRRAVEGEPQSRLEFSFAAPGTTEVRHWMVHYIPSYADAGEICGIHVIVQDMTEAKRTRMELEESESRFRTTFEQTSVGIAQLALDGRWLQVNERLCEIVGYSAEELLDKNFRDITHPDDCDESLLQPYRDMIDGKIRRYSMEKRYLRRDGSIVWVYLTGALVRDERGTPLYEISVIEDITARKQAELALADRNARLRAALEASTTGTFQWNIRTNALDWDENLDRLFGLVPGSKVRSLDEFIQCVHPDDRAGVVERCRLCAEEGADFDMEFRVVWPDGSVHWLYDRGKTTRDRYGVPSSMTGACVDITAAKRTEEALRSTDKLAAVGRMAASISHEINNPLEAVTNLLYLAENSAAPEAGREYVQQAQQELGRVAHVVTQTLRFYRPVASGGLCDISQVVGSVMALYRGRIQSTGVQVASELRTKQATCNEGELRQVLGNIVGNALDATATGGRVLLRSSRATDHRKGRTGTRISVADTGSGIAAEHLSQIFEPFFSTKPHTGTGLGLWVSREIIEKRHGSIRARSTPGKGTVVSIFLPD